MNNKNWFYKISDLHRELFKYFKEYLNLLKQISKESISIEFNNMLKKQVSNENQEENWLRYLPNEFDYFGEVEKQYTNEDVDLKKLSTYTIGEGDKNTLKLTINYLSFIMITSNRYEKLIEHIIKQGKLNGSDPKIKQLQYKLYDKKNCSISNLLECMYIYNNTIEEDLERILQEIRLMI